MPDHPNNNNNKPHDNKPTTRDILLSGALAAATVDLLVYPLDTIKTRLQSPHHHHHHHHHYHRKFSPMHFRGLYQGVGSVVFATIPSSALFFGVYETMRTALQLPTPLASAIAELASCAVLTPVEVVKQNAQVLNNNNNNNNNKKQEGRGRGRGSTTLRAFSTIKRWQDLWRGYGALAGRNLPFTAMQFPLFEMLKKRWGVGVEEEEEKEKKKKKKNKKGGIQGDVGRTILIAGCAAGVSGSVAAVVTTPIDVVKTRIMLDHGERKPKILDVVRQVVREEGLWRGLWRGGALRGVWTMVGSGLYLGVYEGAKVGFVNRRRRRRMMMMKEGREALENGAEL